MTENTMRAVLDRFITATNAFDLEAALELFDANAVIEDPSVGEIFAGQVRIRDYLQRFFLGYRTNTRLLSAECPAADRLRAHVDFTGDFGHEIGILDVTLATGGLIGRIDADLE